ncbi:MAG: phage tail protein [Ruminiclostridium sp.]|nr:phage tail protein [Ruminiclostridium sp.]
MGQSLSSEFIPGYSFTVNLDGFSCSFGKVQNISSSIEVETIVDGGNNSAPVILRKPKRNPDFLVLERALHSTLTDIAFAFFDVGTQISSITISVKKDGKTVRMFFVTNGVIVEREFSPLDAMDSAVLVQSMKIAHNGITELPLGPGI